MRDRSRRIQNTITAAFAILVFATALVMAVLSYTFTRQTVQDSSRDYTAQLIDQIQTNIDSYITHMENIAEVVQLNDQVQRYFSRNEVLDEETSEEIHRRITSFLNTILRTRDDVSLILIAGDNGTVLTHDDGISLNPAVDVTTQPWYRRAKAAGGSAVVSSSHVQNIVDGEYRWVITLSRTINDPLTGEVYGVMLVDLNFSEIRQLLSRISPGKRGYLFVVDRDGGIVYHPRQELIYSDLEREYIDRVVEARQGSFFVEDEKGLRIYTVSTSARTGWRTVGVTYAVELVQNRATIQRYYFYWTLLCIVFAILISVLISHHLSRPILQLRSSMRAVERGDFDISVEVDSNNEIGDLARDFTIMIARIKELVRRNAEEQEAKRRSELMALQNQITPHFLYNTLDSIVWMAEGKKHTEVVKMVSSLARLLRLSISRGDELVSIRDEIEHVKSYLTIQQFRYRDTVDYKIEVDEEILDLQVPKVILQPLVENAIYHGVKNKSNGGQISVNGRLESPGVVLRVEDDGIGMSDQKIRTVLERPNGGTVDSTGKGAVLGSDRAKVGVRNVHERIQLYFGAEYGLAFERNPKGGTTVAVLLPVLCESEGAAVTDRAAKEV